MAPAPPSAIGPSSAAAPALRPALGTRRTWAIIVGLLALAGLAQIGAQIVLVVAGLTGQSYVMFGTQRFETAIYWPGAVRAVCIAVATLWFTVEGAVASRRLWAGRDLARIDRLVGSFGLSMALAFVPLTTNGRTFSWPGANWPFVALAALSAATWAASPLFAHWNARLKWLAPAASLVAAGALGAVRMHQIYPSRFAPYPPLFILIAFAFAAFPLLGSAWWLASRQGLTRARTILAWSTASVFLAANALVVMSHEQFPAQLSQPVTYGPAALAVMRLALVGGWLSLAASVVVVLALTAGLPTRALSNRRLALRWALWSATLVVMSSWFGLVGRQLNGKWSEMWDFFSQVWQHGFPGADLIFVAGTVIVGALAVATWSTVERRGGALGVALGTPAIVAASVFGHWVVYAASFSALPRDFVQTAADQAGTFRFVGRFGYVGLAVAAAFPLIAWATTRTLGVPAGRAASASGMTREPLRATPAEVLPSTTDGAAAVGPPEGRDWDGNLA